MWLKMGLDGYFLKWKRHTSIQMLGCLSVSPSVRRHNLVSATPRTIFKGFDETFQLLFP